jgi:hypothetical protein
VTYKVPLNEVGVKDMQCIEESCILIFSCQVCAAKLKFFSCWLLKKENLFLYTASKEN